MARPLELKGIASILKRNKAQREQPLDVGASQDPLSDAVFDVPTDAPADYGDAGATPVLGNPDDTTLAAHAVPGTEGGRRSFSGRYGERVRNAGPDDLTLASTIGKVGAGDTRLRNRGEAAEPLPSDVGKEPAGNAEKSFPTEQVSFGGVGDYNYTFIPTPDQDGPGIIKGEGMRGEPPRRVSFVLDPSKGMSEKNTKAYGAILREMATRGYESPLHKLGESPATTAPEAPAEAPVEEEPDYGTSSLEGEAFSDPGPSAEELGWAGESDQDLPYEAQRMAFAERQFERPRGDVGGRLYDAAASVPDVAREAKESFYDPSDDVPGHAGPYSTDAAVAALKRRAEPDPRRKAGDIGGRISDFVLGKRPGLEEEASDKDAFYADLLGPSFQP